MSASMLRAERSAPRVPQGEEILAFLKTRKATKELVAAALAGEPPVTAISSRLVGLVQAKNRTSMRIRQFVGISVRAILEREGFEVERAGVWLTNDPFFSTGSTYRKVAIDGKDRDFLKRFVSMLTKQEVTILHDFLTRRLSG